MSGCFSSVSSSNGVKCVGSERADIRSRRSDIGGLKPKVRQFADLGCPFSDIWFFWFVEFFALVEFSRLSDQRSEVRKPEAKEISSN